LEAKSRLLVVGGTGFIGHHLLRSAVKRNWEVTNLSLNKPISKRWISKVRYHHGNLLKLDQLKRILCDSNFEYVVNLGGYINHTLYSEGGRKHLEEHFTSLKNLIEILPREHLKAFIQIGSSDEYGNAPAPQHEGLRESPISPYSSGKVAATHFLQMLHRTENFPATLLRLFITYGPGQNTQRFLPQIIKGCLTDQSFPTSNGEQLRDFCYVEDVVDAIFLSLETIKSRGEVLNIASGQPVTIRRMIEIVQGLIDKGVPRFGEFPYRPGENMCLYADINKARDILGWSPTHSLESGLKKTISWYLKND